MTPGRELDPAQRRLLFWLWTPYLSDVALIGVGCWLVATGDAGGWWAIVFALVRAVLGTISIIVAQARFRTERQSANPEKG